MTNIHKFLALSIVLVAGCDKSQLQVSEAGLQELKDKQNCKAELDETKTALQTCHTDLESCQIEVKVLLEIIDELQRTCKDWCGNDAQLVEALKDRVRKAAAAK